MDILTGLLPASLSLSVFQIILRTTIIYILIVAAIRLFGKRELAQLSITDLVLILLIANSVQTAMVGVDVSLTGGIVAAGTLFVLNYIFGKLFYSSKTISGIVEGHPIMLIYKGRILESNLRHAQITRDELEAVVREHGVEKIPEVNLAILETDGNISVLSNDFKHKTIKHRRSNKAVTKIQ